MREGSRNQYDVSRTITKHTVGDMNTATLRVPDGSFHLRPPCLGRRANHARRRVLSPHRAQPKKRPPYARSRERLTERDPRRLAEASHELIQLSDDRGG